MSEAQKLLDKAARAISAAERLMEEGLVEFAAGRAYYAMFLWPRRSSRPRGCGMPSTAAFMPPSGSTL